MSRHRTCNAIPEWQHSGEGSEFDGVHGSSPHLIESPTLARGHALAVDIGAVRRVSIVQKDVALVSDEIGFWARVRNRFRALASWIRTACFRLSEGCMKRRSTSDRPSLTRCSSPRPFRCQVQGTQFWSHCEGRTYLIHGPLAQTDLLHQLAAFVLLPDGAGVFRGRREL